MVYVNESVFEMLNIHIWAYCNTFHCKQTICVLHVNGKSDRGNASDIQAVCKNRRNWFFKCPSFWQFGINWTFLNVNITMALKNYAKCEFEVYVSTDVTAVAASCSALAAFILTPEDNSVPEMRIWSILLIKFDFKWCIHLSRSLFYISQYISDVYKFKICVSLSF